MKPLLLLIPGMLNTSDVWRDVAKSLNGDAEVLSSANASIRRAGRTPRRLSLAAGPPRRRWRVISTAPSSTSPVP